MQTTPNLGLPQFEPTDKYRLEDYNEAYAKIDEKIKEAQDLIATWTQFKTNGGDIATNLNINCNADTIITSKNSKPISLMTKDTNGSTLGALGLYGSVFRPTTTMDKVVQLGQSNAKFKDVWIGDYSRASDGYTKLPNGMIMQWGKSTFELPVDYTNTIIFHTFTLPISFPNSSLFRQLMSYGSYATSPYDPMGTIVTENEATNSTIKVKTTITSNNNTSVLRRISITYLVIGY